MSVRRPALIGVVVIGLSLLCQGGPTVGAQPTGMLLRPPRVASTFRSGKVEVRWRFPTQPSQTVQLASSAGYRVYFGPASRLTATHPSEFRYRSAVAVASNQSAIVLTGLTPGETYFFAVTAVDGTGIESAYSNEASLVIASAPTARFSVSRTSGQVPLRVELKDRSSGLISGRSWRLGDQHTYSGEKLSHRFTVPGTYTIRLTVTGPGGSDSATQPIRVMAAKPVKSDTSRNATTALLPRPRAGGKAPTHVRYQAPGSAPAALHQTARRLTLAQSLQIALQHNFRIRIAQLTRDEAQPGIPEAKALFHPTVGLSFVAAGDGSKPEDAEVETSKQQQATAFVHQFVPTGASVTLSGDVLRDQTTGAEPLLEYTSAISLSVVQPLLREGGFVVATQPIRDAEFDFRIAAARLRAELLQVTAATKSAYYNMILAEKIIAATQRAIARDKTLIEASKALFKAGLVSKEEVASATLLLAEDSVTLVSAQADLESARNDLLDNLGIPMATEVVLVDTDLTFEPIALQPEDWVAIALRNRPELFEGQEELAQSHLNMTVAKNARFPQLDLVGSYQRAHIGSTLRRSVGLDGEGWTAGLVFSVPFGNVAATSAVARAKRESQRIQLELEQERRRVELEVRQAVVELRRRLAEIPLLKTQVEQAQSLLKISRAQFSLGRTNNRDIIDTYADLLSAETDLLGAIVAYHIALAELEASLAQPI